MNNETFAKYIDIMKVYFPVSRGLEEDTFPDIHFEKILGAYSINFYPSRYS